MGNLWAFLSQTLAASGTALFLLLVKGLFQDKLSPRWQFSVWSLLAAVLVIPAGALGRHILVDWALWIDAAKSCWFGLTEKTVVTAPVPLLPDHMPAGWADWLFLLYLTGVVFFALRYLVSYIRLRRIIRGGVPIPESPQLREVRETWHLPHCRPVAVEGISSAFVCGVLHPVLVLPADRETDRKVLLHELLHLKNRDVIWGVVISVFRCIHWCNPLLWYCADQAMNDMETLCDQRVLERLEGEQRREYGKILLSMANEKYARAPGTSSAANGGKNIRRRIEAIARFKRYPAGMGLVSVCILVTLISPLVLGFRSSAVAWAMPEDTGSFRSVLTATAACRTPCTTVAGALDTYAKAVLTDNLLYRAASMSSAAQQKLLMELHETGQLPAWSAQPSEPVQAGGGYWVLNVIPVSETEKRATVVVKAQAQPMETYSMRLCLQQVALLREQGRWVVEPLDDWKTFETFGDTLRYGSRSLPGITYAADTEDFRVEVKVQQIYETDNWTTPEQPFPSLFTPEPVFNLTPNPNAEFSDSSRQVWGVITYTGDPGHQDQYTGIGLSAAVWDGNEPRPELRWDDRPNASGIIEGTGFWGNSQLEPGWESTQYLGSAGDQGPSRGHWEELPAVYAADLYLNGEKAAELRLERQEGRP